MLFLVLAYRHEVGVVDEYVDGHQRGVGEQSGVDALAGGLVAHDVALDVVFLALLLGGDAEGLAGLVLERCRAHEFADAGVHVHQQVHLGNLRHVALHIYYIALRVEAGGYVFGQDLLHVLVEHLRVGMGGEGVEVGDDEAAVVVVLHAHELIQSAEVVAQVQIAGGADAAEHYFLLAILVFHTISC